MKVCPKCEGTHEKPGTFCSRKCANSRQWTDADKLKKSISAKNSEKVQKENESRVLQFTTIGREVRMERAARKREEQIKMGIKPRMPRSVSLVCKSCGGSERKQKHCSVCNNCREKYYKYYRPQCEFKFSISDYPELFDIELLRKYGMYSPSNKKNNPNGVSRDHKLSVRDAWKLKLDPVIVRHPLNCQIVRHRDNQRKHSKSSITVEELLESVAKWQGNGLQTHHRQFDSDPVL